jgi:hypothetical protein
VEWSFVVRDEVDLYLDNLLALLGQVTGKPVW